MSNWKVLVIDDEAQYSEKKDSRYQKYIQLEGQHYDPKGFHLIFAKSPGQAKAYLQAGTPEGKPDIVLLDVRLWKDDEHGTLFKDLFRCASERYVVALISNVWDHSSMKLVRGFLSENPKFAEALEAGAAGVAIGRNVWQQKDAAIMTSSIVQAVHGEQPS